MESVLSLLSKWSRLMDSTSGSGVPRLAEPTSDTERRLVRRLKAYFGRKKLSAQQDADGA